MCSILMCSIKNGKMFQSLMMWGVAEFWNVVVIVDCCNIVLLHFLYRLYQRIRNPDIYLLQGLFHQCLAFTLHFLNYRRRLKDNISLQLNKKMKKMQNIIASIFCFTLLFSKFLWWNFQKCTRSNIQMENTWETWSRYDLALL